LASRSTSRRESSFTAAAATRLLGNGTNSPPIQERVPLAEAPRAQTLLESGRVLGKLVLKP